MDGLTIAVSVGLVALFTFLLTLYQELKKSLKERVHQLEVDVKVLEESKTRNEQRFIQINSDKKAAEKREEEIKDKLDKIYDILLNGITGR